MKLTMNKIFGKLRRCNKNNYLLFLFCVTLSVMLITSFASMLYMPAVQSTLPEGGDSRKQIYMIFAITLAGCLIFTIYSSSLFLKYKSRETGVFLALGAPKNILSKTLLTEMAALASACIAAGLMLGFAVSAALWRIFEAAALDTNQTYKFSKEAFGIGLLFGLFIMSSIAVQTILFMKKTNMMDILYAQRKNEPLKEVTRAYGVSGIVLLFLGILLGYGANFGITAMLGKLMPPALNALYLLSLLGIYRIITYAVASNKRGKNPQKYYKNIIAQSMMKFQGRQTVRNMCIIAMLLSAGLFAAFYTPQLLSAAEGYKSSPFDFSLHYKASENELGREDFYLLAGRHGVTVTDYQELIFSEMLGSGISRDWDNDGNLTEEYRALYNYYEFIDASAYNAVTGRSLNVDAGSYYAVESPNGSASFYHRPEDLDLITNPITNETLQVSFAGTEGCQELMNNGSARYILNDGDYAKISAALTANRQTRQILFNVEETGDSLYAFGKDVYGEFLSRASAAMAVMSSYDEYEEYLAVSAGEDYFSGRPMVLTEDNPDLMAHWKYYPLIKIIIEKTFFKTFAVYFLVFIYAAIICLAASGIISYTRSVTIGMTNKQLFDDLRRLGASREYIAGCVKRQLNKIFVLPTAISIALMCTFTLFILLANDGKFSGSDARILLADICISLVLCVYQYVICRVSLAKIRRA